MQHQPNDNWNDYKKSVIQVAVRSFEKSKFQQAALSNYNGNTLIRIQAKRWPWLLERGSIYNILSYNFGTFDLPTPKRQKMWDYESRAGKSSKKWLKSSEMSQISKWKDFQWVSWVLEVTYHFKAGAINITVNFTILLAAILKHEKHAHLVAGASCACCRLRECNQTRPLKVHWI